MGGELRPGHWCVWVAGRGEWVGGETEAAMAGGWGALGNHTLYAFTLTHRLTWAQANRILHLLIQAANEMTGTSKRGKCKAHKFRLHRTCCSLMKHNGNECHAEGKNFNFSFVRMRYFHFWDLVIIGISLISMATSRITGLSTNCWVLRSQGKHHRTKASWQSVTDT